MTSFQKSARRGATLIALVAFLSGGAVKGEIQKPDCAALEKWATAIDGKDRVQPVEGSRAWVPRAFTEPGFAALFGSAALEWKQDDANQMAAHLYACGDAAGKARRNDARKALFAARGFMIGNLRGVLALNERHAAAAERTARQSEMRQAQQVARERQEAQSRIARGERSAQQQTAQQKPRRDQTTSEAAPPHRQQAGEDDAIAKAVDAFLAEPDKLRLMRRLRALQQVDPQDPQSYNIAVMRSGPAGNQLLYTLRRYSTDLNDPRVAPRLRDRAGALKSEIAEDYAARAAKLDPSRDGLRFLERWDAEVDRDFLPVLGEGGVAPIHDVLAARREAIRSEMVTNAKDAINKAADQTGNEMAALNQIDNITGYLTSAGIPRESLDSLRRLADERRGPLAERAVKSEITALDTYEGNLKGLEKLLLAVQRVTQGPLRKGDGMVLETYLKAAREKLTEVADAAFPEFEQRLAAVPESAGGLNVLGATLIAEPAFQEVGEDVRENYVAAVTDRRDEIASVVAEQRAESREKAIAAGGDPDLVGFRYSDAENKVVILFQDEKQVAMEVNGKTGIARYAVEDGKVTIFSPGIPMIFIRTGTGKETLLEGLGMRFLRIGG